MLYPPLLVFFGCQRAWRGTGPSYTSLKSGYLGSNWVINIVAMRLEGPQVGDLFLSLVWATDTPNPRWSNAERNTLHIDIFSYDRSTLDCSQSIVAQYRNLTEEPCVSRETRNPVRVIKAQTLHVLQCSPTAPSVKGGLQTPTCARIQTLQMPSPKSIDSNIPQLRKWLKVK